MTLLVKECVGRCLFVHHHPSGDPMPSRQEDVRFTQRLIDAARILDIRVLDHVVVAATGKLSRMKVMILVVGQWRTSSTNSIYPVMVACQRRL